MKASVPLSTVIALLWTSVLSAAPALVPGLGFDANAYRVTVTPDFSRQELRGVEEIELRGLVGGIRRIAFSAASLEIDSATFNGELIEVASGKNAIVFTLPQSKDASRSGTLRISYHGKPTRGLVFTHDSVYTSYWACDWMICPQDAPGDKARIDVTLRLPKGMISLSAGRLVSKVAVGDGIELHHWRSSRPYSPYLYGFAAGYFNKVVQRQGDADLVYLSDVASEKKLRGIFGQSGAMVRYLSDKAGLPLPEGQYTQLLVLGSEAQEAATYALIGEDQANGYLKDRKDDWAMVHELAHQWWGNLVTCKSWDQLWLSEGVAVFMTAAWKEHQYGREAYEAELDIARKRWTKAREAGWDKPLAFAGKYPSLGTRRAIQYSKGALFMDHLRSLLGDEVFWRGLKMFTQAHAGGVVVSSDMQHAMEQASNRDLSAVFAKWVYASDVARHQAVGSLD